MAVPIDSILSRLGAPGGISARLGVRRQVAWSCFVLVACVQVTPSQLQDQRFESKADAAIIRVWANDSEGRHVANLVSGDFLLRVNGEPQEILTLGERRWTDSPDAPRVPSVQSDAGATIDSSPDDGGARYVLFFDLMTGGMNILEATRAFNAGSAFLNMLSPGDRVALVLFAPATGFQTVAGFTSGHSRLSAALDGLRESQLGLSGRARTPGGMLLALALLANTLENPGLRADILFFSLGDSDRLMAAPGYTDRLEARTRDLARRGAVVHTLNPASLPPSDATALSWPGPATAKDGKPQRQGTSADQRSEILRRIAPRFESALANRGPLRRLAELTGGLARFNRHTFPEALPSVIASSRSFYELAFAIEADEGTPIKLRIEARDPNVRVRCWPCQIQIEG